MSRVALIHFDPDGLQEHVERLGSGGHEVQAIVPRGSPALRPLFDRPPDAIVIDLARRPGDCRYIGIYLRQRKATRGVPLVFVDGEKEKVALIRQSLPDAAYTDWEGALAAVDRAVTEAAYHPVVPRTPGFYTDVPLPKKLNVRPGVKVAVLDAPENFAKELEPLPDDVTVRADARAEANLILLFARSVADLRRRFPVATRQLAAGGGLWICWPKKSSGFDSDLSQDVVRAFGLGAGLVDYKIAAIDETWSGLLFGRRRRDEDDEA